MNLGEEKSRSLAERLVVVAAAAIELRAHASVGEVEDGESERE